jgi:hypothetical protein
MPQVHTFPSSGDAYDATQCRDDIKNGDILACEDGVIGLAWTWPIAVTANYGKLHTVEVGQAAALLADAGITKAQAEEALFFAMVNKHRIHEAFQPMAHAVVAQVKAGVAELQAREARR